jgi:CheY-like chemotaxis protein
MYLGYADCRRKAVLAIIIKDRGESYKELRGERMSQGISTILVIEADPSLQRLITLGLQQSGMEVIAARSLETLPTLDTRLPDLLVMDVDASRTRDWSLLEKVRTSPMFATLPTVVLTWDVALMEMSTLVAASVSPAAPTNSSPQSFDSQLAFLDKPFDARALQRTIKQLLHKRAAQQAAQIARAEAAVLATYYSRHTSPSVWPLVTAAGLLLAVIGLLFQLALTLVGGLIVVVALLLWTMGARPEATPAVAGNVS